MKDYLFRGSLASLDPQVYELTQLEAERQYRRLILIPSESSAPLAVREALSSAFQNIYAEGYPDEETRRMGEGQILDYSARWGIIAASPTPAITRVWNTQTPWRHWPAGASPKPSQPIA